MSTSAGPSRTYTAAQRDRIAGTLVALAAGDALGAPHEFGPPLPASEPLAMTGGGGFGWAPGEWTDDTSMAVAIGQAALAHDGLTTTAALDEVVAGWCHWAAGAKDVGVQTGRILGTVRQRPTAAAATAAARTLHEREGRSGGNGALMRNATVVLATLHLPDDAMVDVVREVAQLTHYEPAAWEACVLHAAAIRAAIDDGSWQPLAGLDLLPEASRDGWAQRYAEASTASPADFDRNGWVVHALQGAWAAIESTPVPADEPGWGLRRGDHLRLATEAAVRGGRDADTVAAIAGAMLGARWGRSAVPLHWWRVLHGWPSLRARDLQRMALTLAEPDLPLDPPADQSGWPGAGTLAPSPFDDGVVLGGVGSLERREDHSATAVVSLCRVPTALVPPNGVAPEHHVEVWLIDSDDADNPHVDLVLREATQAVLDLRADGHRVLLHCVAAQSRTPTVAALHGARVDGVASFDDALAQVRGVLADAAPRPHLAAAARRLTTDPSGPEEASG